MPGLLDLPSELLFEIIDYVASSPYPPIPGGGTRYRPQQLHCRAVVCFPDVEPITPNCTNSLLQVCRKLNLETTTYLSKVPQVFQLDIAIVSSHWIWPCWRHIPGGRTGYVLEDVQINLIFCFTEDELTSDVSNLGLLLEEVTRVISHFLRCGPSSVFFESTSFTNVHANFHVKNLNINVDSNLAQGIKELSTDDVPFRRVQDLAHLSFDTLYLNDAATSSEQLDRLASYMNDAIHHVHDGFVIRERVDVMTFSAGGQVRAKIDIKEYMSRKQEARITEYKRRESLGSLT